MRKRKCERPGVPVQGVQENTQVNETEIQSASLGTGIDAWIRDLGQELIAAYQAGNRALATEFKAAMYAAIRMRSPEQQHRRHMDIDARIWGPQ